MYSIHGDEPPDALEQATKKADKRTKKARVAALAEAAESKHDGDEHDIGDGDSDEDLANQMSEIGILEDDFPRDWSPDPGVSDASDADDEGDDSCEPMYVTDSDDTAGDTPASSENSDVEVW